MPAPLRPQDQLALRAALLSDDRAIDSWLRFRNDYTFDDLYFQSIGLVPIMEHNLSRLGYSDKRFGKMLGVQRKQWLSNQLLLQQQKLYLDALRREGIKVILVKEAALSLGYYQRSGLRHIEHFQFLVQESDFQPTLSVLAKFNLRRFEPNEQGRFFYLYGSVLEVPSPRIEKYFWQSLREISAADTLAYIFSPTDQLIHTLFNTKGDGFSLTMWIADCLTIAQSIEDSSQLFERLRQYRLTGRIKTQVGILSIAFPESRENSIIRALSELPTPAIELIERPIQRTGIISDIYYKIQRRLNR